MLKVLSASMNQLDVANMTIRSEAQRLEGENLLMPAARFDT